MKTFDFKKIDAFTRGASSGNPAGYVHLQALQDITADEMQKIARELKGFVNEVGFVAQTKEDEFELRYYSSEREVEFCGHATIAIMYDLAINDKRLCQFPELKIHTNMGKLAVQNRVETDDCVFILSPPPVKIEAVPTREELCLSLNIEGNLLNGDLPIEVINAGLNTLVVPVSDLSSIIAIKPELSSLNTFCEKNGLDIIIVFTEDTVDQRSDFRTRVFAPTYGYLEDPATGSGNSALGNYLIDHGIWSGNSLRIEQNGELEGFNTVELLKEFSNGSNVWFGGAAVVRIEGKYLLQDAKF